MNSKVENTAENSQLRQSLLHATQLIAARTANVQRSLEQTGTVAGKAMHVDRQDWCYSHVIVSKVLQLRQKTTHAHLCEYEQDATAGTKQNTCTPM